METVLVVGATGNVGVSAIIGSLRSGFNVLAVVRNQASAEKLFEHVGKKDGITIVEADVTSDDGIRGVVDRVRAGDLPAFQHVYTAVGQLDATSPVHNIDMAAFRSLMHVAVDANFLAYKETIPYLLEQANPNATWTIITGASAEYGVYGATAITQGALISLSNVACRENQKTNVRCNEVYLSYRVDYDAVCEETGTANRIKASDFARVYEGILSNKQIEGCRVSVLGPADVDKLKYKEKFT